MPKDITVCPIHKAPPREPRDGEVIGGGYFVIRRGKKTGRLRPSAWPMEYDSYASAEAAAIRLSESNPDKVFYVAELRGGW